MNNSLVHICYEGDSGNNNIRTLHSGGILHISLSDVITTLNKENRELNEQHISKHMTGVLRAIISDLDDDEYLTRPFSDSRGNYDEYFITQPGLNRVMSSNKSKAGKKFQRWLYHEVIPSLIKHETYPPPSKPKGSALSQLAEITAQNSRAIADMIVNQEELENTVAVIKTDMQDVSYRVKKLEVNDLDSQYIMTIEKWINDNNHKSGGIEIFDLIPWCEKLILQGNQKSIPCQSGKRENQKFPIDIINEALTKLNASHPIK